MPQDTERADLIGRLVDGRYQILEAMASGSMGAVYKAERVPVGKLVAIKFLHAAFANDAEFLGRFERETRVASKLAHPNCVSVVDFGVYDGAPYLVMDFVAGQTLRTILDDARLPPARALAIARQIAAGLAHAHEQGVVHRDVKPANIMLTEQIGTGEIARILDFGLARLRGAGGGRDATLNNVVVGTPNYMAPEQTVGGGTIDARTDVYAVGVVLFEMIAGDRPFQSEDTLALLGMHRAAPIPRLVDRVPEDVELPAGLQALIEKAMAKAPDDRYQSALELAEAIDVVAESRPDALGSRPVRRPRTDPVTSAPTIPLDVVRDSEAELAPPPRPRRSGMFGALLVVGLLGGGAYGAWYLHGRTAGADATGASGDLVERVDAAAADPAGEVLDAGALAVVPPGIDPDAAVAIGALDAGAPALDAAGQASAGDAGAAPGDAAVVAVRDAGAGTVAGDAGSTVSVDEIELAPDPATAEDLAPRSTKPAAEADDEAADAPASSDEGERRAPPPPRLAPTIHDAVVLIKQGKAERALASLLVLKKKNPHSAYVPFLLGNLYFDKRWWSVALDYYRLTISKNAKYKQNPTLNNNVIKMLASSKTVGKASYFLQKTIGRASLPYLRHAAQRATNPHVRWYAGKVAARIR